jgi:ribonuclease D
MVHKPNAFAPLLRKLFNSTHIRFIFHHAAFDIKFIIPHIGCSLPELFACTKTMSKLAEPAQGSGLGKVVSRHCCVQLEKGIKHTWDEETLNPVQTKYAIEDVLYLHKVESSLRRKLIKEGLSDAYDAALLVVKNLAYLNIIGYEGACQYEDESAEKVQAHRDWWEYMVETNIQLAFMKALDVKPRVEDPEPFV